MSDDQLAVKPLACPECSAAVPLAEGDSVVCPYCGATVPVPESYRTLRDAHRIADADRERVEAAFAKLGRPPGFALRSWAALGQTPFRAVGWMLERGALVSGTAGFLTLVLFLLWPFLLKYFVFDAVATSWGFDLYDVMGVFWYALALVAAFEMLFVFPIILLGYRRALAARRGPLRASMAARPPAERGGAAHCRACGAPLTVPAGALGVRCAYCGSDNLVALPPEWVARVGAGTKSRHASVLGALNEEAKAVRDARGDLRGYSIAGLCLMLLLATSYWLMARQDDPPSWYAAVTAAPRTGVWMGARLRLGEPRSVSVRRDDLLDKGLDIDVALHKGETFSIVASGLPPRETLFAASPTGNMSWNLVQRVRQGGTASDFTAPYSGWFAIRAHSDFGSPDVVDVTVTLGIRPTNASGV